MFSPFKKVDTNEMIDPLNFLLVDNANSDSEDMLNLKLKRLEHTFGLKPTDDLAIVRLIT